MNLLRKCVVERFTTLIKVDKAIDEKHGKRPWQLTVVAQHRRLPTVLEVKVRN